MIVIPGPVTTGPDPLIADPPILDAPGSFTPSAFTIAQQVGDPAGPASILPGLGITGSLAALIVVVYLFLQHTGKTFDRVEAIAKAFDERLEKMSSTWMASLKEVVADFKQELTLERADRHKIEEQFLSLSRDQANATRDLATKLEGLAASIREMRGPGA